MPPPSDTDPEYGKEVFDALLAAPSPASEASYYAQLRFLPHLWCAKGARRVARSLLFALWPLALALGALAWIRTSNSNYNFAWWWTVKSKVNLH